MHTLTTEQTVTAPLAQVSDFFSRPENLARLTPPHLAFEILTPLPVTMRPGAVIDYLIRLGPLPMRWRTLISDFDPPHGFVDQQLSGPYSFWHHTHTFIAVPGGIVFFFTFVLRKR